MNLFKDKCSSEVEEIVTEEKPFWLYTYPISGGNRILPQTITETSLIMCRIQKVTTRRSFMTDEVVSVKTREFWRIKGKIREWQETDFNKLINGTSMLLEAPDKEYYINTLKEEFKRRLERAKASVIRCEQYLSILDNNLTVKQEEWA